MDDATSDPALDSPASPSADAPGATRTHAAPVRRERRWLVRLLIYGTTVLAVLAIFAVWANRQLLNPNNWANTSTRLLQNAQIREATSNYLVDQLYANVNVAEELKTRLPAQLAPLAGPLAGAIRSLATEAAQRALEIGRIQEVWKHANRASIETF